MEYRSQVVDTKFTSPEEEIAFLRGKIAEKEKEALEKDYSVDREKIVYDQISKYRDSLPEAVLDETYKIAEHDLESLVLNLSPEKHDKKITELLGIMNEKGIKNAFSVLSEFKDPHLEDDFHRFLVQYVQREPKVKGIKPKESQFRGLGMTLYEVVLTEESGDRSDSHSSKPLKEIISGMEQFFAGMMSISEKENPNNYFVLEMANPNGADQVAFYVAVPNSYKDLFQKQIVAIYHNIKLTEVTDDYNIFNQDGISVGSYLTAKESSAYPFKTYDQFDHDPMNVILSTFSKLKREGEGAGIQIIFSPRGKYFHQQYEYAISKIESGEKAKDALDMPESVGGALFQGFKEAFKSAPKEGEEKKIDNEAIQKIKNKLGSSIVATNIRLVASAESRPEAERILHELQSSFNQFTDTTSNGLEAKKIENDRMQKLFRDFSFRVYNDEERLPLNLREVATLIHFENSTLSLTPQLKQTLSASAPAPFETPSDGTFLGTNRHQNIETKVYMGEEDRLRHFYAIGQTGTGKSTLLKNMIIQDIRRGDGVCFIDPHGMDILDILANIPQERFEDVIYFDPSHTERPMALNMLEYDPAHSEQKTFVVNELFSIFQKLYGAVPESMGPMFEQYFRNATMLVIEDPETGSTLLDVSRVMANKAFRELKISRCKNPVVVEFWKEVAEKAGGEASLANMVPYITSKFDVFLANDIMRPIIAQEKSSFNFRDIMDNRKILLVNLSKGRLGDINANLIGLILVGKILMSALSRNDIINSDTAMGRPGNAGLAPFYLYIDEFQNITTNSIATILSEARKYKLSLSIAHQFIAQLDERIRDAVFGNVGSICAFRVGAEDAEYLEKQFSPQFSAKDIMNIDNLNAYLKMLVNGKPAKAFNVKIPFAPKGNPAIVETLKQLSYLTYGGDRGEIEAEILKKYKK